MLACYICSNDNRTSMVFEHALRHGKIGLCRTCGGPLFSAERALIIEAIDAVLAKRESVPSPSQEVKNG